MSILKADFTRDLVLSFASRLKLPSMFIVLKKKKKKEKRTKKNKKKHSRKHSRAEICKGGFW